MVRGQPPALRHGLHRVQDQIEEYLRHILRIRKHRGSLVRELPLDIHVVPSPARLREHHRALQHLVH